MAVTRTALQTAISDTGSTVASLVLTLSGSVPQGATIALASYHSANNASAGTMADSSGNTYTAPTNGGPTALNGAGTNGYLATYYADNALALVAGDTITFTPPASAAKIALEVSYLSGSSVPSLVVAVGATGSSTSPASGTPTVNATNALPAGAISLTFVGFRNASSITETFTAGGTASAGQSVQGNASAVTAGIFEEYASVNGSPPNGTGTLGHSDTWAAITLHFRPAVNWFYDYEAGSDFNGGDSFATLGAGTAGVGAGTTAFVLDVGNSADSTWLGRFINVSLPSSNTQGLYLIVAVTDGTHVTLNATVATNTGYIWNVGGRLKTPKFGMNVGQNSPTTQSSGSGFKGPGFQAGDTARLKASTDAQDVGTTALFTSNTNAATPTTASKQLTLTSAQNTTITTGDSAWTASANVTCTADASNYVNGSNTHSAKQAIATAFTTGLAAFFATGTLDLSGSQLVCFWIYTSVAIAASQYSLRLCSDTAGVTTVNTIAIPPVPTTNTWTPVVADNGSALGSSIKSVALYVDSDQGAVNINLCGIFAAKASGANSLTLHSLVGKNTVGEPWWWAVRAIEGTTLYLESANPSTANNSSSRRGYYGVTETVELYKRDPIVFTVSSTSSNTFQFSSSVSGAAGSNTNAGLVYYNVIGGWDRTNMSSQSGQTWLTFSDGSQSAVILNANYQYLDQVNLVRAATAVTFNFNTQSAAGTMQATACATGMSLTDSSGNEVTTIYCTACNQNVSMSGSNEFYYSWIGTVVSHSSQNTGLNLASGYQTLFGTVTCCNNTTGFVVGAGVNQCLVTAAGDFKVNNGYAITASAGASAQIQGTPTFASNQNGSVQATAGAQVNLQNATSSDSTVTNISTGGIITFTRYGGTATDHRQYFEYGTILSDTSTRHTAAGASWKLSPTSVLNAHAKRPLRVKVQSVALKASEARTLTCWVRRNAGGITSQICIPGGQAAGLSTSDAVASSTQVNAWEQLSLTITPTVDCVVDVYGQAYGGTTLSAWFQDVAVA